MICSMFSSARLRNSPSSPARRTSLPAVRSASWRIPKSTPAASQQPRQRERVALVARVEARVVADEPQHVDGLLAGVAHLERRARASSVRACAADSPNELPLVATASSTFCSPSSRSPCLDQAAPQQVDDRHVLDADRADLDAGHALHARPERVGARSAAPVPRCAARCRSSTRSRGDSGRPGGRRRAGLVAAAAARAGVEVDQVPRQEVGERRVAGLGLGRQRRSRRPRRAPPRPPARPACAAPSCGGSRRRTTARRCRAPTTSRAARVSAVPAPSPAACSPLPTA